MWINYGKLFALQINISFLHACFFKMLETITHSKITQRKKKTTFNSASTTNQTNIW